MPREGRLRRTSLFHSSSQVQVQVDISTSGNIQIDIFFKSPVVKLLPPFTWTVPDDTIKQDEKELENAI
jgi:hypothetical protein